MVLTRASVVKPAGRPGRAVPTGAEGLDHGSNTPTLLSCGPLPVQHAAMTNARGGGGRVPSLVTRLFLAGATVVVVAAATSGGVLRGQPAGTTDQPGYGLWPQSSVPVHPSAADSRSVTVGVTFSTAAAGSITAVEFYQAKANTGPHRAQLWSAGGRLLAQTRLPPTDGGGWRSAILDEPVRVVPGRTYVASYAATRGHYAADPGALSPARPRVRRDLTALAGVYHYGEAFPDETWHDSNYFVDVRFVPDGNATPGGPPGSPDPSDDAPASGPRVDHRPDSSNTGVPVGTRLHPVSGDVRITRDGTVIDGEDITGTVTVEASGVVIRNSWIHGSGSATYGIYAKSGDVTIEDSEIWGFSNGIGFDNWSARRVDIHGMADDGVKLGSNVSLEDSWIHDMHPSSDAHADGAQMQGGSRDVVVRHNVIDMSSSQGATNAALFLAPDQGPNSPGPLLVQGNWLDGGNYTLYCVDGANGRYTVDNISIVANRFGTHFTYGPVRVNVPVQARENVMDATGAPLRF